jgi:hypothetical protein
VPRASDGPGLGARFRRSETRDRSRRTEDGGVDQLAGGGARAFNNILVAILLNLDLLRMRPKLDPAMRHHGDRVIGAASGRDALELWAGTAMRSTCC